MAPSDAVQKQIEKANALHAQVYGPPKPEENSPELDVINNLPGAEPKGGTPPEPPAEPAEPTDTGEPEGGDSSPAEPEEPAGSKDDEPQDFEHKYNVLQGKYNAEVPRLNNEVKTLHNELNSMRRMLASLEGATVPVQQRASAKLLNEDEIDDYGEDMIDVIKRAAREELAPTMERLEEENAQLRATLGRVSESVSESARDTLYQSLDIEIPNWKEINQETGFLEWLEGIDTYAGMRRGDMLTQAFENNDAARVVAFFKGYLSENAMVTGHTPPAPAQSEPKIDLMSMAAPGTPKGNSQQGAHSDKRVYTQADIAAFYRDVQKGLYKDAPEQKLAIERDILSAGREGRLR